MGETPAEPFGLSIVYRTFGFLCRKWDNSKVSQELGEGENGRIQFDLRNLARRIERLFPILHSESHPTNSSVVNVPSVHGARCLNKKAARLGGLS